MPSDALSNLTPREKRELLARLLQKRAARSPTTCPLSPGQSALWFLHRLAPDSAAYNIMTAVRIHPAADVPALRAALQALVDRHAILRTTYASQGGEPMQVVAPSGEARLETIDAEGWSEAELRDRVGAESDRPFDLETGPVLRTSLFRRAADGDVLVFVFHHIAIDFWSLDILRSELERLYTAIRAGQPVTLPPVAQFTDYVRWQAAASAAPQAERAWNYWRERLSGQLPPLELPLDRPRPPVQTYRGASHSARLDQALTTGLRAMAVAEGTTLYTVVLAAFQVLLSRYSGQEDVPVGSPMVGRSRPELDEIVGYLINPVVLRGDLSGDPSFLAFLGRTREAVLGALAHQDFPFPVLVERLRPRRDASRSPLFQVAFFWDRSVRAGVSAAGMEPYASGQRGAPVDLTLTVVVEGDGSLETAWLYNPDLFEAATVARMVEHFRTLLEAVVARPEERISRIHLLSESEERRLAELAHGAPLERCPYEGVHRWVERQTARTPSAVAVICGGTKLTYTELDRRAQRLAGRLVQLGVGPDSVVAIRLDRSAAMVVAMLAVLKSGGAYLPMEPAHPPKRAAFMLRHSGASVLLTEQALLGSLPEHGIHVVVLGGDGQLDGGEQAGPARPLDDRAGPDHLAYVIYTSGSTGSPKGVQVTCGALAGFLRAMQNEPGIEPDDVLLAVTTLTFDIAVLELLLPLTVGARVVIVSREVTADGVRLAAAIREHGATVMQATPAGWRLLLEAGWAGSSRLTALCGGEVLPWALATRLVQRVGALWNLYGPTEATVWCAAYRVGEPLSATVPIGGPIAGASLYLLDARLRHVPPGVPGELYVGGGVVARGYVGEPAITAAKFIPDPFATEPGMRLFCTGDRARRLENGALEFLGRVDHQMKLSGYRIEPGEVEAALAAHPGVRESAVVVREDPHGEHRLVAYFVPRRVGGETPTSRSAGWSASSGNGDGPRRYRLPNGMEVVPHDAYQTNAVFKEVFEDRTYLRHGISLKEGDCVFDVGANIGLFTLFAHAECGRARIYAFEPLPPNFERLRSNVALNRVDAVVFPCGLADRPGRADFTFYPRLAALSGRFPSGDTQLIRSIVASFLREARVRDAGLAVDAHDLDAVETYLESEVYGCELRTLSDVIDEHSVERIDLLKIDAEKSELDILRGLRDEHWPRVRQMVLEVHTRPLLDAILQLLERHGFDATYDRTVVVEHGSEFIYMLYAARRGERGALDPIAAHTLQVPAPGELRRFLRERLPDYMVPTAFVAVDAFPLTLNRKVDRLALPAPTWERPETETDFEPPREGTEVLVAALWAEVLGIARVGANDNFFDLGGASLQTLRVAERARAAGLPLIPELLFQYQTVRELAEALERRGPDRELPAEVGLGVIADPTGEETPADGRTPALAIAAENTVIESLAVYLPPRVVSTDEVLRGCSKRMLFPLERMTGIRTRRMAGDTEFSIDLAARAVADCLARSRHAPADIDLVVCCNISRFDGPNRFSFEPGTAVALRERFGLVSALAFDVSNACTGVFTAINLADAWLRSGAVRRVLVVSGEYISHLTATAQREIEGFMDPRLACLTLGDAGVAMVLERSAGARVGFQEIDLYTLGRYSGLCVAKATDRDHGGAIMLTDAIRQTAVGVAHAVSHSAYVLRRGGWRPEAFDHLVMHQTSETALREAMRAINQLYRRKVAHEGNTVINLRERGNTATTTHWVALADRIAAGTVRTGDRVIFGISGSGQTIGTALYTFDDLPERLRGPAPHRAPEPVRPARRPIPAPIRRTARVRVESVGVLPLPGAPGRTALEMARCAAEDCLARSRHDRSEVELLLYAGVYRDEFLCEPAQAAMLAGVLAMNHDVRSPEGRKTLALDVFNGAVGFLNACWAAAEAILAGKFRTAMVATAEVENNRGPRPDRLLGLRETGSALILDEDSRGESGFGAFTFTYRADRLDAYRTAGQLGGGVPFLRHERAPDLHAEYLSLIEQAVRELLAVERMELARVKAIFPPQLSPQFVGALAARLGVPRARLVDASRDGDLFTSSLPYALRQAREQGQVAAGDLGVLVAVGSGLQVGCALYRF